jgi:hypothetical protein
MALREGFLVPYKATGVNVISFVAGEVGNVADDIVVVTFSKDVNSPGGNYDLGVTIRVNGVIRAIIASARQPDNRIVRYTLVAAVVAGDTVTWEYDAVIGDLEGSDGSGPLPTTGPWPITNNVVAAGAGIPIGMLMALTYA